ncbi:TPA: hypothetical protein DCE37_07565 [Candidatus Latescibacteria bacterium]|nr:hypothetical protein [Candidatus Latescibacterota bacterium]
MAIFPQYDVKERAELRDLSVPILQGRVVVVGTAESLKGKHKWPDGFYGSRVGLNTGFDPAVLGGVLFAEAIKSGRIRLREANSSERNLRKLVRGRIDFYLNDRMTGVEGYLGVVRGQVTTVNEGHIGYTTLQSKFAHLVPFVTALDSVIVELRQSGEN